MQRYSGTARSCRDLVLGLLASAWLTAAQADEPVTTPPTVSRSGANFEDCYPKGTLNRAYTARLELQVTIAPDGRLTSVEVPLDVPAWISDVARCAVHKLKFGAGTVDGVPVESHARVPVTLELEGPASLEQPAVSTPVLRSSEADIESAYRRCYPADANVSVLVGYRIDVGIDGRVRRASVVKGGGDRAIDKAGICVLKQLQFSPPVSGNQGVRASFDWTLIVRPPLK